MYFVFTTKINQTTCPVKSMRRMSNMKHSRSSLISGPVSNHINFVISILCVCISKLMLFPSLDFVAFYESLSFLRLCNFVFKKGLRICKIMYFMLSKSISRTESLTLCGSETFFFDEFKNAFFRPHCMRNIPFRMFLVLVHSLFFLSLELFSVISSPAIKITLCF